VTLAAADTVKQRDVDTTVGDETPDKKSPVVFGGGVGVVVGTLDVRRNGVDRSAATDTEDSSAVEVTGNDSNDG